LWEATGELGEYVARTFRTSVACLWFGGMSLDLGVLGAAGLHILVCAPILLRHVGAGALRDHRACQKTSTL